jgi:hypothetical protein
MKNEKLYKQTTDKARMKGKRRKKNICICLLLYDEIYRSIVVG